MNLNFQSVFVFIGPGRLDLKCEQLSRTGLRPKNIHFADIYSGVLCHKYRTNAICTRFNDPVFGWFEVMCTEAYNS